MELGGFAGGFHELPTVRWFHATAKLPMDHEPGLERLADLDMPGDSILGDLGRDDNHLIVEVYGFPLNPLGFGTAKATEGLQGDEGN